MTRTLCTIFAFLLLTANLSSCSLFGGDTGSGEIQDVDAQSTSSDILLDAEDEILDESDDLAELDTEFEVPELDDFNLDEDLDNEMESASISDSDSFGEEEFNDGSFDNESFDDEESFLSSTSDQQVDPALADEELEGFEDFDEEGEFALEEEPVIDLPSPEEPVVDIPLQTSGTSNQVKNLEYKAFASGGTVVIETVSPVSYEKIIDRDLNQVIIEINDVFLPERFKLPYITKDFKQDIATINAYANQEGGARFVIQLKRPMDPIVQQEGASLLIMTTSGPSQASGTEVSEQPLDQLVAENQMSVTSSSTGGVGPLQSNQALVASENNPNLDVSKTFGGVEKSGLNLNQTGFVGEKINIEYIDTDVREIIETISERSGVNLVMDSEVSGKTSIRLRDIPWDQALVVLLRSEGLGYVKQGNVLRIAKQQTLSTEAQAVSAQIQSEKKAQLLSGGLKVKYIPVSYADVKELSGKLKEFTSDKGKITHDDRTSSLVITDYGEYIERITDLVKALDTAPMQVEIEAKLVEARETFIREAGINWDIAGQSFPVGSRQGTINSSLSSTGNGDQGFSLDLSIGTFDIFGDLSAALSVFESDNKIRILSNPRIVTMNKVEASITQTLQVPIQETIITPGAPAQVTFRFVDIILGLVVKPQITFKGDVILAVDLSRDFAGDELATGAREINKRKAKSTVMIKNGKTAVIGGIYQVDDGDLETGIPLLKDIPLIGYLFKQTRTEKIKNELLLFLKPKILREVDGPMVSKAASKEPPYDPFEELSVDEGSSSESDSFNDVEGFDDFDDFEDEVGESLNL